MTEDQWYIRRNGEQLGPVSFGDVMELVDNQQLADDDELRIGGDGAWQRADSIDGLFPEAVKPHDLDDLDITFDENDPTLLRVRDGEVVDAPAPPAAGPESVETEAAEVEEPAWFCRTLAGELGPMPFEEVVLLAESGNIGGDDQVRRGLGGFWKPAALWTEVKPHLQVVETAAPTRAEQFAKAVVEGVDESPAAPSATETPVDDTEFDVEPDEPEAESSQPKLKTLADVDTDRWYCRVAGDIFGPVAEEEVKKMAQHGRLKRSDFVRKGDDGDWLPAAARPEFFDGVPMASEPSASSPVVPVQNVPLPTAAPTSAASQALAAAASGAYATPPKTRQSKPPREGPSLGELFRKHGVAIGIGVGAVAVVALLIFLLSGPSASSQEAYDKLAAFYAKYRHARKQGGDISSLEGEAQGLKAELASLEKTASAKRPLQQRLLWASQNAVKLFRGKNLNEAERDFVTELLLAKKMLNAESQGQDPQAIGAVDIQDELDREMKELRGN